MIRKVMLLLLALMLFSASAAGAEQTDEKAGILDLYLRKGDSRVWLGTAVPLAEESILTSAAVRPGEGETLELSDGLHTWVPEKVLQDQRGLITLLLLPDRTEPEITVFCRLYSMNGGVKADDCVVLSAAGEGQRNSLRVLEAGAAVWQETDCMLVQLSGDARLGSPVLTGSGELVGLIAAQYAEGPHRYMMLTVNGLVQALTDVSLQAAAMTDNEVPEGFLTALEGNRVTLDWSRVSLPKTEGMNVYTVVADLGNSYLTFFRADQKVSRVQMLLTPGRTYLAGMMQSADSPEAIPDQYVILSPPSAQPLRDHGFRSVCCGLTENPEASAAQNQEPALLTEVTEEQLRSGTAFFYSSSVYEVAEREERPLLITLTDPDDHNYQYESTWVYDPTLKERDVWWDSPAEMGLLRFLNEDVYPKGTYRMSFYVGDALADSFTFEIK
ncbi:MAG: hypothetical protein J6U01_06640 [Clostridia bacterium]|nr:hypothetical protein [Clostridia bacterium]